MLTPGPSWWSVSVCCFLHTRGATLEGKKGKKNALWKQSGIYLHVGFGGRGWGSHKEARRRERSFSNAETFESKRIKAATFELWEGEKELIFEFLNFLIFGRDGV